MILVRVQHLSKSYRVGVAHPEPPGEQRLVLLVVPLGSGDGVRRPRGEDGAPWWQNYQAEMSVWDNSLW